MVNIDKEKERDRFVKYLDSLRNGMAICSSKNCMGILCSSRNGIGKCSSRNGIGKCSSRNGIGKCSSRNGVGVLLKKWVQRESNKVWICIN